MTLGTVPVASEVAKRNLIGSDERLGNSGGAQPLASSLSNRMILQQHTKSSDGSGLGDFGNIADAAVSGRTFHLFLGSNGGLEAYFRVKVKWDREDLRLLLIKGKSFCRGFRGCSKSSSKVIAIFSECLVLLEETLSHSQGSSKTTLLQQLSSQNSSISSQGGLGLGFQSTGLSTSMSASVVQQPMSLHQQGSLLGGQKDSVVEDQQQQSLPDDSATEMTPGSGLSKHLINDDDLKASYLSDVSTAGVSGPLADAPQRDIDLSPGQPLQSGQQSSSLGVIGRRSVSDLGAIGDSMSGTASSGNVHDYQYNLQMLEAAYFKLPQPKDSERAKSYTPQLLLAIPKFRHQL